MSSATSTKESFSVGHLFVLLSLMAATVAVVLSRPATPESLILISLTIGAAGFAAVCFYRMLAPLVAPHADLEEEPLNERLRADLEREKTLTLRSIKELEFDRAMGKLSQQDFDQMAGRLRARAMGVMKQLDAGVSDSPVPVTRDPGLRTAAPSAPVRCACGVSNDHDAKFCKSCGTKLAKA
ncbi:MAG TPA: zinc ribbon domain-containing protein [Vicinamibacterales bacterium]|jgi:hypothetical protein|nr:zinc ribbon domain-containing protein [Vicinamibacterales bacterium]